jgi:hypothetical protein
MFLVELGDIYLWRSEKHADLPLIFILPTYRLRSGTNAKLSRATADIKRTNAMAHVSASTGGSTGPLDLHRKSGTL